MVVLIYIFLILNESWMFFASFCLKKNAVKADILYICVEGKYCIFRKAGNGLGQ